jgi:hypothetical protein
LYYLTIVFNRQFLVIIGGKPGNRGEMNGPGRMKNSKNRLTFKKSYLLL